MRVSEVARQLSVSPSAVRTYVAQGRLTCTYNPGGQRIFTQETVDAFLGKDKAIKRVYYVRSSSGSKALIESQIRELTETYGEPLRVYSDNASGLSEHRRGLEKLLRDAGRGKFNEVCVTYEDRLSRFGTSYLIALLEKDGVSVKVLNDKPGLTLEDELLRDFMSLLASFSGRFYRLRSKTAQHQLLIKAKEVLDE